MCHNNGSALLVNCFCPCQERLHQGDTKLHTVWTSNLVSGMWQYGIDQWVGRNEFLYGKTKEERLAKTTQEVDSQIRHMHRADRKRVRSIDKHLFHMSAEQRITHSIHCCFLWIDCVILCSAGMWNRCLSMEQTRFLSALCICRIWESTSWVVFASLSSLVFP